MSLVRFRFWARRCSSMVEHQPSKLNTWVRFPSPALEMNILFIMREWLSWWSTTLPRSGPRVRVPSRALFISPVNLLYVEFTGFFIIFFILIDCKYPYKVTLFKYKIPLNYIEITGRQILPASLIHF